MLPNFAMTDYASQGKTRPYNVVDLSQARSHQSYYTALSRSATAAGTLILNSIHPSKITGGASGALRQEFRELELLDDITALQFDDKLPTKIAMGDRRYTLINLFIEWKGEKYIPSTMHPAIRWSKADPFHVSQDGAVDCQWRIIDSKVDTVSVTSLDKPDIKIPTRSCSSSTEVADTMTTAIPLPVTPQPGLPLLETNHTHIMTQVPPKRKRINSVAQRNVKKVKFCHDIDPSAPIPLNVPLGTQWQNNSCAYDAIITVLFNIWFDFDTQSGTASIEDTQCVMFNNLIQRFRSHESLRCRSQVVAGSPTYSLEQIREYFRHSLARVSQEFTFGSYASVQSIAEYLFHSQEIITTSNVVCLDGHRTNGRD